MEGCAAIVTTGWEVQTGLTNWQPTAVRKTPDTMLKLTKSLTSPKHPQLISRRLDTGQVLQVASPEAGQEQAGECVIDACCMFNAFRTKCLGPNGLNSVHAKGNRSRLCLQEETNLDVKITCIGFRFGHST